MVILRELRLFISVQTLVLKLVFTLSFYCVEFLSLNIIYLTLDFFYFYLYLLEFYFELNLRTIPPTIALLRTEQNG